MSVPNILAACATVARTALLAALAAGVAGAGCATTVRAPYNYASEPDPRTKEYVIGPSDALHVTVWHNPDLSGQPIVRPDGTISLPLIGDLRAAGRTPGQIRNEVTQRLGAFLKDESAIVTVAVTAIHSYRFVVSGNVEHQGEISADHYVTVAEAIALAGGPNKFATSEETVIMRPDAGKTRRIPIDYPAILSGLHPEQDLPILAGDMIYVP